MRAPRLLAALIAAAGLACAQGAGPSDPEIAGTPLGRSAHPRAGSIRGGRKRLRARVTDVPFPVKDVTLELLYAVP